MDKFDVREIYVILSSAKWKNKKQMKRDENKKMEASKRKGVRQILAALRGGSARRRRDHYLRL